MIEIVLQNSLIGILFLGVILVFRQLTGIFSKLFVKILWILLLVELLLPPVAAGPFFSMRNLVEIMGTERIAGEKDTDEQKNQEEKNAGSFYESEDLISTQKEKEVYVSESSKNGTEMEKQSEAGTLGEWWQLDWKNLIIVIWITGMLAMTLFYLEQFLKLKRCVKTAVRTEYGVWESENIDVPFVMPGFSAVIYLPVGLEGRNRADILAHERTHIRYLDPWIKVVAAVALIVHWFNPFVWLAYRMMAKDMEMFCDEGVLKGKSFEEKKQYTQTLLDFAVKNGGLSITLSFGESNTKNRIRHILNVKKPKFYISILLVLVIFFCGIFFLTTGRKEGGTSTEAAEGQEISSENLKSGKVKPDVLKNIYTEAEPVQILSDPIAGRQYTPEKELLEKIKMAEDYSDSDSWYYKFPFWTGEIEDEGKLYLIGKTEQF